ncbi:hypothetical protein P3T27_004384 [Kitasatospora sp. MAA19]|nr:hypothetical protein [Kitasatospora sp. MAA19]
MTMSPAEDTDGIPNPGKAAPSSACTDCKGAVGHHHLHTPLTLGGGRSGFDGADGGTAHP